MKLLEESGSPVRVDTTTALCTLRLPLNPLLWKRGPSTFMGFLGVMTS